jgi:tetratricopeptide (TPR) repeat protein
MRKLVIGSVLLLAGSLLFGQEAKTFTAETEHYKIVADASQSAAEQLALEMEACWKTYSDFFHFDGTQLAAKLKVKLFRDADSFNKSLEKLLGQSRKDFVFIAYSDPEKSELLCFPKETQTAFDSALIHQGCIQYLKAFTANPPVWLREGIATYLEGYVYDAKASSFTARPNLLWLDALKASIRGESAFRTIPMSDLLVFTREMAQENLDIFYPQSWGLIQFLINSPDKAYNRVLWDSIAALDSKAALEDNSQRIRKRVFGWIADSRMKADFEKYILSLKTAADLVKDGMELYGKGDYAKSEEAFLASIGLENANNVAYYYLGLISYNRKEYTKAEDYYMKAFELGTSASLINYALGVNAFANRKLDMAAKYLSLAKNTDPANYGEKVDVLMKRIELEKDK